LKWANFEIKDKNLNLVYFNDKIIISKFAHFRQVKLGIGFREF